MTVINGTYQCTLDNKGRLMMPAKLRDIIMNKYDSLKLYITNAPFDKCLNIFPAVEWQALADKLKDKPRSDKYVQFFIRRVFASAVECEVDKQGRIMIPYELRNAVITQSEIVLVGMIDRLELWDKSKWDEVIDPDKHDMQEYAKALADMGI